MNERTKELWKQATEYAFSVTTLNETPKAWEELKLAKFAELIVRESRLIVSENFHECNTAVKMDKILAKHFGVE
jgi:hypothetical protein